MKILLTVILLLFSHLAYAADIVNLSSATRTKSVNATVGLSSAARGGGGGGGGYNWSSNGAPGNAGQPGYAVIVWLYD